MFVYGKHDDQVYKAVRHKGGYRLYSNCGSYRFVTRGVFNHNYVQLR